MKKLTASLFAFSLAVLGFVILMTIPLYGQDEVLSISQSANGDIIVKLNKAPDNADNNPPLLRLYEIVKVGNSTKTVFRTKKEIKKTNQGKYEITIPQMPKPDRFIKYEADISNYLSEGEELNFRTALLPAITASIISGNNKEVILRFLVPKTVKGGCGSARSWLIAAFQPTANTKLKVTRPSNETLEFKIIDREILDSTGENSPETLDCSIRVKLILDKRLPTAEKLNPAEVIFTADFIESDRTVVENPSFSAYRDGIKGSIDTKAGLNEAEKRDEERKVVLEFGGGLTTAKQKEEVTDPDDDRETTGFLDLRVASPTFNYYKMGNASEETNSERLASWRAWTPLQFEAMISEGKLEKKNLATNTMRLFTQYQFIKDTYQDSTDFLILNLEAGAAADRDLRVIDYTGNIDFRWEPNFLNRVLRIGETDKTPRINFQIMPASVELGKRQERRDPFFPGADSFIRRFRFSEKLDLQFPPYAQLIIDHRSWIRGEVSENRFRNYFKTTLNLFPRRLSDNFSAGVFFSYERGTLPPFSTPSTSTYKLGFRIRRRQWLE